MRVTLGFAWEGHEPDETIEVPDKIGRRLLHEGKARRPDDEADELALVDADEQETDPDNPPPPAEDPPFLYMTVRELRAFAQEHQIDIPTDVRKRLDIAEVIRAARTRDPESAPDSGNDDQEEPDGR